MRQPFIERIGNAAMALPINTKIFPSIIIAQAILESGWGRSDLFRFYNNAFGIKADKSWKGKVVDLKTREVINGREQWPVEPFRVYDSLADSIVDHSRFLTRNPRYRRAGVLDAATPQAQATALQLAGYATDPKYARTLRQIIADNDLEFWDKRHKKKAS